MGFLHVKIIMLPAFIAPYNHPVIGSVFEMLFINLRYAIYKTKMDVIAAMKVAANK